MSSSQNNELEYRGYFILDLALEDWAHAPKVLVFKTEHEAEPIGRFDTLLQAMGFVDKTIHALNFNNEFEDFIKD